MVTSPKSYRKPATCHPDKGDHAWGLCHTCYVRGRRRENPEIRAKGAREATVWKQKHPEKAREHRRRSYRKNRGNILRKIQLRTYKLTQDEFDLLFLRQLGACAICGGNDEARSLSVDHCHKNKRVRGLLCLRCNMLIGHAKDNVEILQSAIDYILANECQSTV